MILNISEASQKLTDNFPLSNFPMNKSFWQDKSGNLHYVKIVKCSWSGD